MFDVSLWSAFTGGLIVFFSPCILPIVPFYLSYMAGSGMAALREDGALPPGVRGRAVLSSIFFSLGIITVFTLLGAAAFAVSQTFRGYEQEFRWGAAAIIFIMSLHFFGVYRIGLLDRQFQIGAGDTSNMSVLGSYVVGLAFAAGWTPCVGGVLSAVMAVAMFESTAWEGVKLLLVFGVGLTLPFVIAAFFIKPFLRFVSRFRQYLGHMEKVMGALLLIFAILLVTNSVSVLAEWMINLNPEFWTKLSGEV